MTKHLTRPVVALCFVNYGPYHLARLRACRDEVSLYDVCGVQMARVQHEYAWPSKNFAGLQTVEDRIALDETTASQWTARVGATLDGLQPAFCAVAGYSHPSMRAALHWCRTRDVPVVLMSDSTAWDAPRSLWKEWIKSRIVRQCAAALVAGEPHAEYLTTLGMPREKIRLGYDVVDNEHFAAGAMAARSDAAHWRQRLGLPAGKFFLASARFVDKKNLPSLLRAFAAYRQRWQCEGRANEPWKLVLAGDGPLREALHAQAAQLGVGAFVHFAGFQQYEALPHVYGLASALVQPSTVEQWGLVVNEAMASSLPVLVSDKCGCASTLVHEGANGFTFDPRNESQLTAFMARLTELADDELTAMGRRSAEIVAEWGLSRFARGLEQAVGIASAAAAPPRTALESLVVRALSLAGR